jgi:hypothetical protein
LTSKIEAEKPRQLSRSETHDLSMIIKDRTKVLKAHAEEQAAACLAEFEAKMATVYKFDDDEVWQQAARAANNVVIDANEKIMAQCKKLGIPAAFAPTLNLVWAGRGQNMMVSRRNELRRVAQSSIDAMLKAAVTRIEHQSLDLRTQVVSMGLLSADAKMFLESLAPVTDAMCSLDFKEIERRLDVSKQKAIQDQRRLYGGGS